MTPSQTVNGLGMYPRVPSGAGKSLPAEGNSLQIEEADARIRTADPFITSEVLYQLSYVGVEAEV